MSTIANDLIDFYYCGHLLSEYNGIIGEIGGGEAVGAVEIGSVLNLNPVELKTLKKRKSVAATYDSCVEKQFSFFKNLCKGSDGIYSREEVTEIIRWLNQPNYEKFTPIYSDVTWPIVHYYASFNVQPITYMGNIIGFQLNMTTNAPFGYYDEVSLSGNSTLIVDDISDEQGFIYPECSITASMDGHMVLQNDQKEEDVTIIANCKAGEKITLNGEFGTITSSMSHPNLYNDFNYIFPKIWNRMDTKFGVNISRNIFSINLDESLIEIKYSPISKFGLV